jgi:HK97 family phage major capsid protein
MNGVGVSGALGVMNSGALITVTRDTGSAILGSDISAMWQRMSIRSKPKSKWYVNSECAPQLDKLFAVGSTAVLFPYAGYTPEGVRTLYGRPVVETEFNAALNTTGDIMLADMSEYLLWEKGGIESASSIHVEFLTDQEVFRFIYRADGQTAIASAITPYKGTNTQSPFVVLGSAT